MEHQTINAYGNEFKRDKYGFDWLFHHELSHEWFGNVMTHVTVSDMWLHEGFGAFMQPEYTREVRKNCLHPYPLVFDQPTTS